MTETERECRNSWEWAADVHHDASARAAERANDTAMRDIVASAAVPDPFSQAVWDRLERDKDAINETWGDARYATVTAKYDVETGNLIYVDDTVTGREK